MRTASVDLDNTRLCDLDRRSTHGSESEKAPLNPCLLNGGILHFSPCKQPIS
jgi:hypothetical protein